MKDILLTGKPGVGKTTIIKKIVARLDSVGGFDFRKQ
ncbi:MAG: nucleoside-triphosphatase [Elusimicrobiota bacterium]